MNIARRFAPPLDPLPLRGCPPEGGLNLGNLENLTKRINFSPPWWRCREAAEGFFSLEKIPLWIPLFQMSFFNLLIVLAGSFDLKTELPATRTLAPASTRSMAFAVSIPPSTSISTL